MLPIKVSVEIEHVDLQIEKLSLRIPLHQIRLISHVVFVKRDRQSLSKPRRGIIDTGAPISVIPHSIWKDLHIKKLTKRYLSGISVNLNALCRL